MNEWKEAFWLTRNVLQKVWVNLLISIFILLILSIFLITIMPVYLGGPDTRQINMSIIDLVFLLPFIGFTQVIYATKLSGDKLKPNLWGSPAILVLNQLAVKKSVIVKHRFLLNNCIAIFLQLIFLLVLYTCSATLKNTMDITAFIVFSLILMSLSVLIFSLMSPLEIAYKNNIFPFAFIIGLLIAYLYLLSFEALAFSGVIKLIITLATTYAIPSTFIALTCTVMAGFIGQRNMLRKMKRFDYL